MPRPDRAPRSRRGVARPVPGGLRDDAQVSQAPESRSPEGPPSGLDTTGLTSAEAARRREEHGPNEAPRAAPKSLAARVFDQLRDPMILLLLGALVVVALVGDLADAAIIAAVVVLNTVIGVVQEVRAANAIAALDKLAAPHATVVRDGRFVRVAAPDVVPGDVVRLEAGDVVPADATLAEAAGMQVDESAMTGESVPVDVLTGGEVLSGTVVTRGRGRAVVTRTGAESGLGRIAALIASTATRPTPLQQRLARLSRQLVVLALALSALVFVLGVLRGQDALPTLVLAVSLAVAAIPESLPAVVSVALALGAYRMARHSALVRWLPAVETLGSVTVLASDKTGTLTEGQMVAQRLWTPFAEWSFSGRGYGVEGALQRYDDRSADPAEPVDADDAVGSDLLLRDLVLCNDARLGGPTDGAWTVVGDPMEAALLVAAAKRDPRLLDLPEAWTREAEVPFDSLLQRMVTLHRAPDGSWLVVCKGAPEVVLDLLPPGPSVDAARAAADRYALAGLRVLAVADAVHHRPPAEDALERGLALRGLVALVDPARPDARKVIEECRAAGIRTILITGDHPRTARAIADELGITADGGEVSDGAAVARGEHVDRVEHIAVYARTRPEQKVDIVSAWQQHGAVVAMTGDGVNDAPALRSADIGVAMGDRGTEVARQAADLVLADDDLRTVVRAVGEGRRIYRNIRTFLRYGLAGGLAEVLVILIGPFLGMPVPLAPGQILWINMLTHGLPGVAFGGEPLDPAVMTRPSPSPDRSVLADGLARQIVVAGSLIAVVSLVAGLVVPSGDQSQTAVFLCLGLAQLGVALAVRAPRQGLALRSRGLELAVAGAALLQVLGAVWSPLQDLLGTTDLALESTLWLVLLAAVPGVLVRFADRVIEARARVRA
ncbi:HAD-IC family P-type ATPase [Nocardioides sp. zg-578]|nr:HAD-IC family P-type ATPase [Nocardioides marmotae]